MARKPARNCNEYRDRGDRVQRLAREHADSVAGVLRNAFQPWRDPRAPRVLAHERYVAKRPSRGGVSRFQRHATRFERLALHLFVHPRFFPEVVVESSVTKPRAEPVQEADHKTPDFIVQPVSFGQRHDTVAPRFDDVPFSPLPSSIDGRLAERVGGCQAHSCATSSGASSTAISADRDRPGGGRAAQGGEPGDAGRCWRRRSPSVPLSSASTCSSCSALNAQESPIIEKRHECHGEERKRRVPEVHARGWAVECPVSRRTAGARDRTRRVLTRTSTRIRRFLAFALCRRLLNSASGLAGNVASLGALPSNV